MVLLAIITSLFVAIQDPIIQRFAVRFAGGYLSEKTGADIKVGRLAVTPDFRVFIDDVTVKDLNENDLAKIGSLRTKINISDLLAGEIHLENVELSNTKANLIKYEGEDKFNFAFLAEAFGPKTEKPEKKPMPITVDNISLKNVDFVYWNQNSDKPEKTEQRLMDYSHIDLDNIWLEAKDFYMLGDSIHANIGLLSANEISGFKLKDFKTDAVVCSKGIFLDGLKMETNNSKFDMDLHMLYDDYSAFKDFVHKVEFDATIRPSDIMLSDIGAFTPVMYKMPDRVLFESRFTGPIEHFLVDDLVADIGKSTTIRGSLSMHPLDFENGEHRLKIKNMRFSYDDLVNFYIPSKTKTIPIPESLQAMNQGRIDLDFSGSYNNFSSKVKVSSGVGNIDASIARDKTANGDNLFSGYVNADRVRVGTIANISKYVGDTDLNADFSIKFPKNGDAELDVDGIAYNTELLGMNVNQIRMNGAMKENRFNGKVQVDDNDLSFDFNGLVDFRNSKYPKSDFEAVIHHADFHKLNLVKNDSVSEISAKVYVNMTGFDIDDLEGELVIDSAVYRDSRGSYVMNDFNASIVNDNLMQRRINLDCDFFNFKMAGQMNFAHLVPVFKEYVNHYLDIPLWDDDLAEFEKVKKRKSTEQDFVLELTLKDTKTLSQLFMPSLSIAKNTTLNGTFTSRTNALALTMRSKNVQIGDLNFNNIELKNSTFFRSAITTLTLKEIAYENITETDTVELGLENIAITTRMSNDTLFGRIVWDDDDQNDHNKALIETYFHPHEYGGIFSISKVDMLLNDSLWTVSTDNYIDLTRDRVTISNLMFGHNAQSIRVDGIVPMSASDTLSVQLNKFDISNFDFLYLSRGFDVDGFISGDAFLSNMKKDPMVLADLFIDKLGVNGDIIGDAVIESVWNNEDKSVDLDLSVLNEEKKTLNVTGSYYTNKEIDNLDFKVELDSLRLNALSPFMVGVVSRMQGYGFGLVDVTGSLKQPQIDGKLTLSDAGCKVTYLNTFYTFNPTILIDNKSIQLENMVLMDTLGNKARVEGRINHNNLKDFSLDLKLYPRHFLAMATTSKENSTFYGTAVANGVVTVQGPFKDIYLDIKAGTQKGTNLTIPLNRTSTVKDNDFIVFVNPKAEEEEEEEVVTEEKVKNNFALNLDIDATDDATLKIMLPNDIGTIDASGNGNVKMSTSTSDDFKMFGGYTITSGRFLLNFKGLVSKTFNLKQGGTISWSGNPTDGRIDATGVYSVKTSLSSLGLQVDSTSSTNSNVNVECLIHLKNALLNPTITFGMNLPNATEDITQTVYSLIDTTNQAVMTSQALSLLILGQFAYAGSSGSSELNLANLIGAGVQVDITENLNLGVKYYSGSADSFDEYQIALRTELFENRLTIETNLGVLSGNNSNAGNASNIVGEFDLYYKLTKEGKLMAHFYNHSNYSTNYNSFLLDKRSPYTQGLGLSYSKSFNTFRDLFKKKNKFGTNEPFMRPKKKENE